MHLVLEGSGHDSFNDAVQLLAVHYRGAVDYLRSFKKVPARPWALFSHIVGSCGHVRPQIGGTCGNVRPHSCLQHLQRGSCLS